MKRREILGLFWVMNLGSVLERIADEKLVYLMHASFREDVFFPTVCMLILNFQGLQDRFMVHVEFILFCLEEGSTEDAHQAALWYGIQTGHISCVHVACMQVLLYFLKTLFG